jgi:Zn-dependent protease
VKASVFSPCPECGAGVAEETLVCSSCRRLVHTEELKQLAAEAQQRTSTGDLPAARNAWKRALELLPSGTIQHNAVAERLRDIERLTAQSVAERNSARKWKGLAIIGPMLVFLLTKGKFLLLGLANLTTLSTMLASVGVFWTLYGWRFGLGLVVSIYIHEMGHVAAMRRFGMSASAPMFVPGFGAFVLLNQKWVNAAEDARIGLAGPLWGLGTAIVAWILWAITGQPIWMAIGAGGAWLNLLNLLPVWSLDGGRAFRALTRAQRGAVLVVFLIMWALSGEGLLILLAIGAAYRLFTKDYAAAPDHAVLAQFAAVAILLALLTLSMPGAQPFQTGMR